MAERWTVGTSIALELESACQLLSMTKPEELPPDLASIPAEWWAEGNALAGSDQRWSWWLGTAAWLAGVLTADDYRTATLAVRELTPAAALQRLTQELGLPCATLPADRVDQVAQLVAIGTEWLTGAYDRHGIAHAQAEHSGDFVRQHLFALTRILKGGDLHGRFWFWLDQAYFQFYHRWRETRRTYMERQAQEVESHLATQGVGGLAPQNPVQYYPGLRSAVEKGELRLYCWIEPFDLYDFWFLYPGFVAVAVGHPSQGFAGFRADAERVATRLKALADPNRLVILRLVRNFAMDNTEMANYLGVSRQTVSVHAQILREAGLIQTRQRGRQASHTVQPGEVERLCAELMRILDIQPKRS